MPRVFRPGAVQASQLRAGAAAEAEEQIDQARYGPQLVLPIESIEPNPRNPRRTFSPDSLAQLATSMKRDGQIQPVVVRRAGQQWQLIAGERRWRAAKLAGMQSVAAVQRDASDEMAFRLALVENMHREDLSHQEKVEALDMLAGMAAGQGLRQVAGELGTSPGWLSRRLSMRQDPVVFPALEEGHITFVQANELLSAPTMARRTLLDRVIGAKRRITFDELRTWVRTARDELRKSPEQPTGDHARGSLDRLDGESVLLLSSPYARLLQLVEHLETPTAPEEVTALGDMVACLQDRWERVRPRRGRGRPQHAAAR